MGFWDVIDGWRKKARDEAARKAVEVQTEAAKKAVGQLADAALDDLETALLGKKGAADEILAKDPGDVDPLDRIRQQVLQDRGPAPAAAPKMTAAEIAADREARARVELAELKRKMGKS